MATNATSEAGSDAARDADRPVVAHDYLEQPPVPGLRDLLRTTWVQRVGDVPHVQRNLPTGGVELHCPVGGVPRLVGPLTRPSVEVYRPGTRIVGARFLPGGVRSTFRVPAAQLVDQTVPLDELWGRSAVVLADRVADAPSLDAALGVLQDYVVRNRADTARPDPLVCEAVRQLMPWRRIATGTLSTDLAISGSQLRRRFLDSVGIAPKALQRTLRFQGFLALVQSAGGRANSVDSRNGGIAELAADVGYADHAHLGRECVRLSGMTPSELVDSVTGGCRCGHDHAASFGPMLRARPWPRGAGGDAHSVQADRRAAPLRSRHRT
jgi:AraC-like DNA-binding protein